ncbi:MAG: nicotinate-nicotinamide nucleotide adenylyltransferase [Kiritimatiellae bacterium]|nr:nicotinate-nicotinamide nucleotide adenylyltransferase [Kiritimatiellia bacterium]
MKLGLFGGSFNPVHAGHVRVAEAAAAKYGLEKVLVVPAKTSPFKTDGSTAFFSDEARWRLVCAACAGHPLLEPCDVELRRGGVSYSIDTVKWALERHPGCELHFIVGEDSVAGLPRWRNWEELRRLAKFVSFPRTPESSTEIRRRLAAGEDLGDWESDAVKAEMARLAAEGRR